MWNFTFTFEVFIGHLKVSDEFETSDLDFKVKFVMKASVFM